MSTEIVPAYGVDPERGLLFNPDTGEAVALADAGDDTLARLTEALREQRDFIRTAVAAVEDELKGRIRQSGGRMLDAGAHRVQLESKREWDAREAWQALSALVEAGLISLQEADEAMPRKTERKPDGRKLNAILTRVVGENPQTAQALAQARSERSYIKLARTAVDAEASEE